MALFTSATALFSITSSAVSIGAIVTKSWQILAVAILLSVIVYQNFFETRAFFWADTIPYLQQQIDDRDDDLRNVGEANDMLASAIRQNNLNVDQLKTVSDEVEIANKRLVLDLQELRGITRNQVRSILNAPTPQSCEAAVDYLRDVLPLLQYDLLKASGER